MKLHYEPTVRLVAYPIVNRGALADFLSAETSGKWELDTVQPEADQIPEFAGRLCFDDRTEVLTSTGWRPLADCRDGEEVATLNPDTREVEYQEAKKVHKYHYSGGLLTVDRRDVSFAVTPEHRQFAASGKGQYTFCPTSGLIGKRFRVLTAADGWSGQIPDSVRMPGVKWTQRTANASGTHGVSAVRKTRSRTISGREQVLALAELTVHYAANGSAKKSGKGQLVIYGRESRRITRLAKLIGLRASVYYDPRSGCPRTHISGGRTVHRWFAKSCGTGYESKRLPDWVPALPVSMLRKLWDVLVRTDGHKGRSGGERFITGSDVLAGQSQEILAKTGHSFSLRQMKGTNVVCHVIRKKQGLPAYVRPKDMKKTFYTGFVYCPSTKNGIVLIRRNGVVHYSGNCYMSFDNPRPGGNKTYLGRIKGEGHGSVTEHVNFGVLFTGVSRSMTHELVRHRAGTAFCLDGGTEAWSGGKENGKWNGVKKKWTLRQLYRMSKDPKRKGRLKLLTVRCFDGEKFVPAKIKGVMKSGLKKVYDLVLSGGQTVRCSKDHRFLTPDGWRPLKHIGVGGAIATNGLPSAGLDAEWLRVKYHNQNLTIKEIADLAGCTEFTVAKWIGRYGLSKEMGKGMTGRTPWNKGKEYTAGWAHTDETKALLSDKKKGANNPQWKGEDASPQAGRRRARCLFPTEPCEACGVVQGHRHHKDRNTLNNTRSNIEFLCAKCHGERHAEEDGPQNVLKVRWMEVVSIQYAGEKMTYDLEVDHPAHNFVANGIVTHNSQLSQRYVDESVAEYVVPWELRDDVKTGTDQGDAWLKAVRNAHDAYVQAVDRLMTEKIDASRVKQSMGELSRDELTKIRKAARGAARSLLPNATETKILVTANVRAWRHMIEKRCDPAADAEIRLAFHKAFKLLKGYAPNLFADYTEVPLDDGTTALTTDTPKV